MLLRLLPDSPQAAAFDIINGAVATGYTIENTDALDFGNAVWQHALSGARGTQGARAVAGEPDNRVVNLPVRIGPSGSVDAFNTKAAYLVEAVDELRRFGGRICWQATTQTPRQYLEVIGGCGISRASWTRKGSVADVGTCVITAQCAPYMQGDPMDTLDGFDTNTIGDYTFDVANAGAGALSVANGLLAPGATGLKRIRHTAKAYVLGDVQATVKVTTGPTVAAGVWGVTARADVAGADTTLAAEIVGSGTNVLRIVKYVAGAKTDLATVAFTPLANTNYWIRIRCDGNRVFGYVYTIPPLPSPSATYAAVVLTNLGVADASRFYAGHVGLRISEVDAAARYDDLAIEPFTYVGVGGPYPVRLQGGIPGDVPALVDATISPQASGNPSPIFGMVSWLERPAIANLIWNGDFEDATLGASGWSVAAVTGVLGAGTSVARITTAGRVKYGAAAGNIVTPATTDTGGTFAIRRPFNPARTYALLAWLSSTSQTTATRVKLGVNSDIATGTAANLSTTPKLYSVIWRPNALTVAAFAAIGVNAATLTNIAVDGACVVESPSIALSAAIASAGATTCTVYSIPGDTPNLLPDGTIDKPFLAMIEQEIVRVLAINPATKTLTIDRGAEGTTAATHAIDLSVVCLPQLRTHLEGKGAFPAWGSFSADGYVSAASGTGLSIVSSALALDGNALRWTPGTSGPQSSFATWFVDPHTLVPDDYTDHEIDVDVWAREQISVNLTGLLVTLSAQPEGGATAGGERTTREFASRGKLLTPATNGSARWHRLGVIPMIVDRSNPQRWRLKLALACTGGASPTWDIDHLLLVASRSSLRSPTGEQWDVNGPAGAYPPFIPYDAAWGVTSIMSKQIRSDGSSFVGPPGGVDYPDGGFGNVLEVPDGEVEFIVKLSRAVPDDPVPSTIDDESAFLSCDQHYAVTPRYVLSRAA